MAEGTKYIVIRKLLKALGLSEESIEDVSEYFFSPLLMQKKPIKTSLENWRWLPPSLIGFLCHFKY